MNDIIAVNDTNIKIREWNNLLKNNKIYCFKVLRIWLTSWYNNDIIKTVKGGARHEKSL